MAKEFFDEIIECLQREKKRHNSARLSQETAKLFFGDIPNKKAAPQKQHKDVPVEVPDNAVTSISFRPPLVSPHSTHEPGGTPQSASCSGRPCTFDLASCDSLESLQKVVANCANCKLAPTRTHLVFGEGNPHAELMFIGEGPGREEDLQGRPFVGAAGQLLDRMISAMQFSRSEVYIANVVKCRPPQNRNPEPDEAAACIGILHRQIELIQPKVIVLLGAVAMQYLLNVRGIRSQRGKWLQFHTIPVMPTYHPSYLLRTASAKRDTWSDLQQVMKIFGKTYQAGK